MTLSDILMDAALGMIIKNNLCKYNHTHGTLKNVTITDTVMDPDEPYANVELTFDDGDTEHMKVTLSELDDLSFCKLYYNIWKNDLKYNSTKWIETDMRDVEDIEILSCEKCNFPTIHRFDYCPNCGRKIIN